MTWDNIKVVVSSNNAVRKYVFAKADAVAESVLYKYPTYEDRTVVCCSTQSGCPVGCRFCGAGDNFVRNLTSDEIVQQTQHLFADENIDASLVKKMQIMFMSMGEPMLNMHNLIEAIRKLNVLYPKAALLVSTSAPRVYYYPFFILSKEIVKVGLQFSVHESTDEKRNELIPFKAKLTLKEIAQTGNEWYHYTGRKPFFNYCAHEGNVTEQDADRLRVLFDPEIWEATISVVCERNEFVAAANARQRELAVQFRYLLGKRDFCTRIFDPAGQDDCGGGCGQLWYVQSWMKEHPDKAHPSIGKSLPVLHTPVKV